MNVMMVFGKKWPRISSSLLVSLAIMLFIAVRVGVASDGCGSAANVILFVGDGMGFEHVRAAGMFMNGEAGSLSFETFPHSASVTTLTVRGKVTDSAAAATAMATGVKVKDGAVSTSVPGDGTPMKTVLERFKECGRSTGLVTTAFISHATPAAFGAHEPSRENFSDIVTDYLRDSRPNVLLGGAKYITEISARGAGYAVVKDGSGLRSLDTESVDMVSGQFGRDHMPYEADGMGGLPHLSEMVDIALAILDNDPDGFFLMVEGGRIDHASHDNMTTRMVHEVAEFSRAVERAARWARGRTDTLIIVTADHETGGLAVEGSNGKGSPPAVTWSASGHTARNVPAYAWGVNASLVSGTLDNTDIYGIMTK